MKIYIGPYKDWSAFHRLLVRCGLQKLAKTLYKRKVKITVHRYDAWNADHTLSLLILPVLKELRDQKIGVPGMMFDENEIKEKYGVESELDLSKEDQEKYWNESVAKWKLILDKIIWSHEQVIRDDDDFSDFHIEGKFEESELWKDLGLGDKQPVVNWEAREAYEEHIREGLRLFGEYYQALWS